MTYAMGSSYLQTFGGSKPPLPYVQGQIFSVRPYTPPAPKWQKSTPTFELSEERKLVHPLERCLLHPPAPGVLRNGTLQLKIVETIRAGDKQNAQIFIIQANHVSPNLSPKVPTDRHLVAKIYDPLYFDDGQVVADPFLYSDQDYSQETASYERLSALQGTAIPRFYGSFTIEIPVPDKDTTRSVRLVLLENIPGRSMQQLKPTDYSQSERKDIIKALIEAETLLYTHDVWHRDIHPRNILILDNYAKTSTRRVVIIDFGKSWCGRVHPQLPPEIIARYLSGIRISPLLRWNKDWWEFRQQDFADWIDWDWDPWLESIYESDKDSITKHMREVWRIY